MKKALTPLIALTLILIPSVASAQQTFKGLVGYFVTLSNKLVAVLVGIAFLAFIWSLIMYMKKSGDVKDQSELKQKIIAGILGLFAIVAIWGLINLLGGIFGIL